MAASFMSLLKAGATREQIEEWCRLRTQSYPAEITGHGIACRVLGKYIMFVASNDVSIAPHLVLDGIWEPWVTMAIAQHVQPGMRCLDVGSCYGYYALLMSDLAGDSGYVQAWEPVWGAAVLHNLQVNGLGGLVVAKFMGTVARPLWVRIPSGPINAGDVKPLQYLHHQARATEARPPDDEEWDFIKIDVEGNEADVWRALAGSRAKSPRLTVCMEFTPSSHEDPAAFLEELQQEFVLGTVGHDGVPRSISAEEAVVPDTGGFRMLWLTRRTG